MKGTLLLLSMILPQGEVPETSASQVDVIVLENGGRIEGRIARETGNYIEIRIDEETVVGFEKSRIESVLRSAKIKEAKIPPPLPRRDQWYVLHDGEGRPVGHMHATITVDELGRARIGEEWRFRGSGGPTEVTMLEIADRDLRPVSCFYHERMRRARDDMVIHERTVRAELSDDGLAVEKRTLKIRERRHYEAEPKMLFPLLALEVFRRRSRSEDAARVHVVYDPKREQFVRRTYTPGQRREISSGGKKVMARELLVEDAQMSNSEFVDGSMEILRREINGPGLVAVPTTEDLAMRYVTSREPIYQATMLAELGGRFAMWLPSPVWSFLAPGSKGSITAHAPLYKASASLVLMDQIGPEVLIESAADDVHRWLVLAKPGFALKSRYRARLRDRPTVCLEAFWQEKMDGKVVDYQGVVHVFSVDGRYLALCLAAARSEYKKMTSDFDRILNKVELHPQSVRPQLQGPLARPR